MPMNSVIRRSANRFPDKVALISKDTRLTYRELNERVNRLANAFLDRGLKKGDRVVAVLHNCTEFIEVYFACTKGGFAFVPINNLLRERELRQIIGYIRPRVVVADPDFAAAVGPIGTDTASVELMLSLASEPSPPFRAYEQYGAEASPKEPNIAIADDDVMSIFLTSGTTGLPKGAIRTHGHNLLNSMACAVELKMDYNDRAVLLFPLYHITFEDHLRHFLMSNTVYIRREGAFNPKEVLEILTTEKITMCQFVPTMINAMLQEKDIEKYDLSALRLIPYAAAPMPVELLKRAMRRFRCDFVQFYGQTETGPMTTILRPEDHVLEGSEEETAKLASAGRPAIHYEVRIVDDDGDDLPVGEVGEIVVRS
ncbi:MAG: AMP-binding protein, partial [Desulfobacteraceae bacterium]